MDHPHSSLFFQNGGPVSLGYVVRMCNHRFPHRHVTACTVSTPFQVRFQAEDVCRLVTMIGSFFQFSTVLYEMDEKLPCGHIGAGELWDTLRKDSTTKLLRNDQRFPQELKIIQSELSRRHTYTCLSLAQPLLITTICFHSTTVWPLPLAQSSPPHALLLPEADHRLEESRWSMAAFSAFVRERLQLKHSRPVERSFCATKDVPDIERLMDQSKLRQIRLYRHKTELMYRSSLTNEDRTSILLHNNPMPDITETGQADSISRYLPSWMDDQSDVSEEEYMKWIHKGRKQIKAKEDDDEDKENARHSAQSRQLSESTKELQSIWQSISTCRKPPKTPRIKFLTEKEAESEGGFTQKFQEERENREKLQPHHVQPFKSHSALELSAPGSSISVPASRQRGMSARSEMLRRFQSEWQPLSMNALVEYKKQLDTVGEGDFEHGRMKMWPVVS
ncbi:hypothetical protein BaRGS_00009118 [Batillaria attramentaria]|uniref:Uncharacterized protein n=1 Tax=Batillaria attramentaria TaxID=370345 RepID=A0ABD0LIX8_9CAEN